MADAKDFDAFYDEQRSWVDYHIRRFRHRQEDRDDLRQEAWLHLWRTWPKYDSARCTPKTWAWLKTREVARDKGNAVANRPLLTVGLIEDAEVDALGGDNGATMRCASSRDADAFWGSAITPTQDLSLWKAERLAAVRRATTNLEYTILELLWVDGMDVASVAEKIGLPPGAVRSAKVRSLQRLINAGVIRGWGDWGL